VKATAESDFEWRDALAMCKGLGDTREGINQFFDTYESDTQTAKIIDAMCLSCLGQRFCLQEGKANGETGVWGGVFLTNGKVDQGRNAHKTPEIWDAIEQRTA